MVVYEAADAPGGKIDPADVATVVDDGRPGRGISRDRKGRKLAIIASALIVLNPDAWKGPICACKCRVRCSDQ
jgi:hypothetical protein